MAGRSAHTVDGIRRRVDALEKSTSFRYRHDPFDEIIGRALEQLSDEDLRAMRDFGRDRKQGIDRVLTERELKAMRAYDSAAELECQRAGFKSLAHFQVARRRAIRP